MENGKYMRGVSGAMIVEKHRPRGTGISGKAALAHGGTCAKEGGVNFGYGEQQKKTENRVWDHGDETHGVRSGQSGRGADSV
jgi:hypothetical protein